MPETATPATELTSHYVAQVTGDLERNVKEQERITAEIASLQEQLAAVQHDHTVLVNVQQALGITQAPAQPEAEAESAVVPSPRQKSGAARGGRRPGSPPPHRRRQQPGSPLPSRRMPRRRLSPLWSSSSAATSWS